MPQKPSVPACRPALVSPCTSALQGSQVPAEEAGPQPSQACRNDLTQQQGPKEWLFNVNVETDDM